MGEFTIKETPIEEELALDYTGKYIKNLKEMTIGNGQVRIANGAIIINDGTNDRVLIGYQKDGF